MNTRFRFLTALTWWVLIALLTGCAGPGYGYRQHPYRSTMTGAALGAAGGALLGYGADDGYGNGAVTGGALGAVVGGAAGYYLDQKRQRPAYGPQPYYAPRSYGYERPRHHHHRGWERD